MVINYLKTTRRRRNRTYYNAVGKLFNVGVRFPAGRRGRAPGVLASCGITSDQQIRRSVRRGRHSARATEGCVLIGGVCNPGYVDVKAICDIRTYRPAPCVSRPIVEFGVGGAYNAGRVLIFTCGYKRRKRGHAAESRSTTGSTEASLENARHPDYRSRHYRVAVIWLHAPVAASRWERGLHRS